MKHSRATAVALSATMALLGLTSCSSPLATQTYLPEPAVLQSAVDCSTANGWEDGSFAWKTVGVSFKPPKTGICWCLAI